MAAAVSSSSTTGSSKNREERSATVMVADQISLTVQSTSSLLHFMLQYSPSQVKMFVYVGFRKDGVFITEVDCLLMEVLEQLPRVISSLDAHMDDGLRSVPHLKTVIQLLANMESCKLKPLSRTQSASQVCVCCGVY